MDKIQSLNFKPVIFLQYHFNPYHIRNIFKTTLLVTLRYPTFLSIFHSVIFVHLPLYLCLAMATFFIKYFVDKKDFVIIQSYLLVYC